MSKFANDLKMAPKIGIVVAEFNDLITSRLLEGAQKALAKEGLTPLKIVKVPGAFEVPLACQLLFANAEVDGIVALGAVIKGSTSHYDYVCSGVTSGIMNVQLKYSKPIGFGVLTCDTLEQALDRVGGKLGNKGFEVTQALLEMHSLSTFYASSKSH